MKKVWALVGTFVLLLSILLVGCSQESKQTPKDTLIAAFGKATEITSNKFEGSMKLKLELPDSAMVDDPSAAMVLNLLNNAELSFRGTSQLDPMMAEVLLTARVTGDTEIAINLSILVTDNKVWVKIPNTPFLPLPENVVGKYLELDLDELSEMAGEEAATLTPEQQQKIQRLGAEIAELFFGAFEDGSYFSKVSKDEAGIPSDVDAAQVVKFELTNDNLRPFVKSLVEVLPALLEKIAELDEAGVTQADIEEFKAKLQEDEQELDASLDELEDVLNIHAAKVVTAVGKNGFVTYTGLDVDLEITADGESGRLGLQTAVKQSEINEKVEFELQVPDASEIITFEELMSSLFMVGF